MRTNATITFEDYTGGAWAAVEGLADIPAHVQPVPNAQTRSDGIEVVAYLDAADLPDPVPTITTAMRVQITQHDQASGPYGVLHWRDMAGMGRKYQLALAETETPRYR